jgi:hypothetical protein
VKSLSSEEKDDSGLCNVVKRCVKCVLSLLLLPSYYEGYVMIVIDAAIVIVRLGLQVWNVPRAHE